MSGLIGDPRQSLTMGILEYHKIGKLLVPTFLCRETFSDILSETFKISNFTNSGTSKCLKHVVRGVEPTK